MLKSLQENQGSQKNKEPPGNDELHKNMVHCRQTHKLARRARQNTGAITDESRKAVTLAVAAGGALLVLGVGVLLLLLPFLLAPPTKESCPSSGDCNAHLRPYQKEVLPDLTDLFPSWWPETPTPTSTPPPMASILQPANCRSGPGLDYPVLDILSQGLSLPINGRNQQRTWWQVLDANIPRNCWLAGNLIDLTGDADSVLVITVAPPEPTPTYTPVPGGVNCSRYNANTCGQHPACEWNSNLKQCANK